MTNYNDIFKSLAEVTNDTQVNEGGFKLIDEGNYEMEIVDVRFDPFKKGSSLAVDYETNDGQRGNETFTFDLKDKNGANTRESILNSSANRMKALIVATQMAGILTMDDITRGDEKVAEALLPMVGLKFFSKVTHRTYEKKDGSGEGTSVNYTHEKNPID
ncbi:DUF669 domain-containing protein [Fructobacillus sp. CRL 2054]|uniref:DUF669 domain-containing protein n=1 Tax=Fructobacillus sp. CRL 2054 TaxID=2763007 RepID=UPI0023784E23|nr:DUF669 domain-containing protein [Fructobacillus sp. CRL 2054]MDD9138336.1 DUF669 domain-containing protein [Fructobacillus sp. CRL 2054]